jgi:hypothetical protein
VHQRDSHLSEFVPQILGGRLGASVLHDLSAYIFRSLPQFPHGINTIQSNIMLFRALIVATFVAAATGQAVSPPGGCLVCGEGSVITAPDAIFSFPGQLSVPCGILQEAGLTGAIPLDQCGFLPDFVTVCECKPGNILGAPTDAPVPLPTDAPVPLPTDAPVPPPMMAPVPAPTNAPVPMEGDAVPCPEVPGGGCSVCGDGMCVTAPESIFVFQGQPEVACSDLQFAGFGGQIPAEQCPFLPGLTAKVCGCASSLPPPELPVPPTAAPVPAMTSAPVPAMTSAPVPALTSAPVPVMTSAPVPVSSPTDAPKENGKGKMGMGGMGGGGDSPDMESPDMPDEEDGGGMMGGMMGGMGGKRSLSTLRNTKKALPRGL